MCIGCRDKLFFLVLEWLFIFSCLFFGYESMKMWGLGGVVFIDFVFEVGIFIYV